MNWKNVFSLPRRKKGRRKPLDQFDQPDSSIDANQVTGGTPIAPDKPGVGWLKSEVSDTPKM